jgi:drug/metabolite transporter (DMT)-like permease
LSILYPLITYVLEALYLGKRSMRAMQVVMTGVSFMGIVLIVQPEFLFLSAAYLPYYVLPIISATCVCPWP